MVSREDERFLLRLFALPVFFLLDLQVDEAPDDVEKMIPLEDFPPEVTCGVRPVLRHVVASTAVLGPAIEGQEKRIASRQPRAHPHVVLADGEVDERPALEGEQWLRFPRHRVLRQPVPAILLHRVVRGLLELALQLQRGYRDAVDKKHQVDAPVLALVSLRWIGCALLRIGGIRGIR